MNTNLSSRSQFENRSSKEGKWILVGLAILGTLFIVATQTPAVGNVAWLVPGMTAGFQEAIGVSEKAVTTTTPVPGADMFQRGYNLFAGRFVDVNRALDIGVFLYPNTEDAVPSDTIHLEGNDYLVPTGVSVTVGYKCENRAESSAMTVSASYSDLKVTANSQSFGFDFEATVEAAIPVKSASVGVSTDVRTSLMFGKGSGVSESREWAQQGYTFRQQVEQQATLYTAQMLWVDDSSPEKYFSFSDRFLEAMQNIPDAPAQDRRKAVFEFFNDFGSHVLSRAVMGAFCSTSVYMDAGETFDSYARAEQTVQNNEGSFLFFEWGESGSQTEAYNTDEQTGVAYEGTTLLCTGSVKTNKCDTDAGDTASQTHPSLITSEPIPIWEVNVPHVTQVVKASISTSVDDLLLALENCSKTQCGGNGYCTLKDSFWANIKNWNGEFTGDDFSQNCVCTYGENEDGTCQPPIERGFRFVPNHQRGTCADVCGTNSLQKALCIGEDLLGNPIYLCFSPTGTDKDVWGATVASPSIGNICTANSQHDCVCADPRAIAFIPSNTRGCHDTCVWNQMVPMNAKYDVCSADSFAGSETTTGSCHGAICMTPNCALRGFLTYDTFNCICVVPPL